MEKTPENTVVIGTADECTIRVRDDPYISGRHAQIICTDGCFFLQDLGSTNGTFIQRGVMGKFRVYGPTPLLPIDTIWLGGRTSIPWGPILADVLHKGPIPPES